MVTPLWFTVAHYIYTQFLALMRCDVLCMVSPISSFVKCGIFK